MAECPREALRDATLPAAARLVLVALWSRAGRERRFVWPSRDTLAADVGANERTLRRNLAILRDRGWIREHVGEETGGNPGWYLCDPPGVPQVLGVDAAVGAHDRAVRNDRTPDTSDREPVISDRTAVTERPRMTAEPATSDRPYSIGTNHEPSIRQGFSPTVQGAEPNAQAEEVVGSGLQRPGSSKEAPAIPTGPDATAWLADFDFRWRGAFGGQDGRPQVANPARGASRWRALQEALDEFGAETVAEVLMHAGGEVQRRLEARGDERVGLHPGRLAVAFRVEAGSFGALLNEWQAASGKKRRDGRTPVAPAELDGIPLSDEEQRVWVRAQGDDPAGAVRAARAKAEAGRELVGGLLDGLNLLGGAA